MGSQYQKFADAGLPVEPLDPVEMRPTVIDHGSVSKDWQFTGGADCCIHPGTALRVAAIQLEVPADPESSYANDRRVREILVPRYRELPSVIMEISFGCLDAPCEKVPLEIGANDMLAKLFATGQAGPVVVG